MNLINPLRLIILLLMITLAAVPFGVAQSDALIHSTERIELARDLVGRANWTPETLSASLNDAPGELSTLQQVVLEAALLPEEGSIHAATAAFLSLSDDPNLPRHPEAVLDVLEQFDLWRAIPEEAAIDRETSDAIAASVIAWVSESIEGFDIPDSLGAISAMGYAGILLDQPVWSNAALFGGEQTVPVQVELKQAINGDGILHFTTLAEHHRTTRMLLVLLQAIEESDPEIYAQLLPLVQAMVEPLTELLYPNADPEGLFASTRDHEIHTALLLERFYALTASDRAVRILDRLYQRNPRPALALLIGPSVIPAKRTTFPSALKPQMGAAWLRSNSLSVLLDAGVSRYLPTSALLSLSLSTHEAQWTPAPQRNHANALNTVLIDGNEPAALIRDSDISQNALITSYKVFPDVGTYVHATATGLYGERSVAGQGGQVSVYERSLFVMDDFSIDLFRVRGGRTHEWFHHAPAPWTLSESVTALDMEIQRAESVRTHFGSSAEPLGFTATEPLMLQTQGGDTQHTLWALNPAGVEYYVPNPDSGSLLARRFVGVGESSIFAMVHRLHAPDAEAASVSLLPLSPAPGNGVFQAIAILIERQSSSDIFFFSTDPSVRYETTFAGQPIAFAARMAHLRLIQRELDSMRVVAGTELSYGPFRLTLDQPLMPGAVHSVEADSGTALVTYPHNLPLMPDHLLDSMLLLDETSAPMFYQPLAFIGESEKFSRDPQRIHVHAPALPEIAPANQGVPILEGKTALYENVAILYRTSIAEHPAFDVICTTPLTVEIPANERSNRIRWIVTSVIGNFRGERVEDRIRFGLLPDETVNGRVRVTYEIQ